MLYKLITSSFKVVFILTIFCREVVSTFPIGNSSQRCPPSITSLDFKGISLPPYLLNDTYDSELLNSVNIAANACCPHIGGKIDFEMLQNIDSSDDIELKIRQSNPLETYIFFPVFANKDELKQFDRHFIGLYESSGLVVVQISKEEGGMESVMKQFLALVDILPMLGACILTAILSGVILWFLDCRQNKEFSTGFLSGAGAGIWWSFVTMTTVGYGDKSPRSFFGRFFGIVWMLLGTVLLSMVSGQITAYLTSFQVAETFSIQGKDVAVPLGMQNFLEKELNLGAKYKEYATKDIMLAVQYHNNSRIDGRNYAVFHDYEKLQTWVLERNLSVTFKVKMTISHRLYLGVVITHIPETAKGFFECLKTVVSDKIAIKKLVERARFRNELNQVSTASQTSTNLETTSLQYLGIAVGIIIAIGLMWELFWRLKNKKSSAVPHPD